MTPLPFTPIQYTKISSRGWEPSSGGIITEANVGLTVNGQLWLTFMCTPTQLEALAVGFLFNEAIIHSLNEIEVMRPCDAGDNVDVWLNHPVEKPPHWRRTSGCTGGVTSDAAQAKTERLVSSEQVSVDMLLGWMDRLLERQELYREVRGVHCSILTDGTDILAQAEDIGRHNTLDKIAGLLLLEHVPPGARMIVTTGRISSEMLQKSARMGASILVSRTSPSSMSIQLAEEFGITLVGYARRSQCNVYTHPERLYSPENWTVQAVENPAQPSLA